MLVSSSILISGLLTLNVEIIINKLRHTLPMSANTQIYLYLVYKSKHALIKILSASQFELDTLSLVFFYF
uniref:Uncharacterized protein n=1 Tax=Anguilla anguilla TaxID=7936 RepID=A0A0E9X5C7_ANGAN